MAGRKDGTLAYLFGSLAQGLGLIVVIPLAKPTLDATEWGNLSLALSTLQAAVAVIGAGLPLAVTREYFSGPAGKERSSAIVALVYAIGLAISVISVGVLILLRMSPDRLESNLLMAAISAGMLVGIGAAQATFRSMIRPKIFVIVGIASTVVPHLGGFASIRLGSNTTNEYMTGFNAVLFFVWVASIAAVRPRFIRKTPDLYKSAVQLGIPTAPHSAALMLMNQGHMFTIAAVLGPAAAGEYYIAQIFALASVTILAAFNNAWIPELFSASNDEKSSVINNVKSRALAIAIALTIIGSGFATLGATVLSAGNTSLEIIVSASILPSLSVGYSLYLVSSSIPFMVGSTKIMSLATPSVLLVIIVGSILAASTGSLPAVAAIQVLGYWLLGVLYAFLGNLKIQGTNSAKKVLLAFLTSAVCSVALMMIGILVGENLWMQPLTAMILLATVVWFLVRKKAMQHSAH